MKLELDNRKMDKTIKSIKKEIENLNKKNEKEIKLYLKESRENLNYIARSAIDKFYEDYEPHFYNRKFDLYNTFKIEVDENHWNIEFSSDFMKKRHRAENKYIYENSFINGYHGGAISGDGHPNPGVAYWRIPAFKEIIDYNSERQIFYKLCYWKSGNDRWGRPAIKSPSPYREIKFKAQSYMDLAYENYLNEYNSRMNNFYNRAKRKLERMF